MENVQSHDPNAFVTYKDLDKYFEEKFIHIKKVIECTINEKVDLDIRRTLKRQAQIAASAKKTATFNFGQESYDHILDGLANYFRGTTDNTTIIQKIIKDLFFHPEQKKNQNVYIPKDSYNYACVFKDNTWGTYPIKWCLESMIKRGNDVLQHYVVGSEVEIQKQFAQSIGRKKYDTLVEFTNKIDNIESYAEFREKLMRDTEHTILTSQHLVHSHIFDTPVEH
jgi:hypothetical protein